MTAIASPLATAIAQCSHCGLAVPVAAIEPEATEQFCCAGCHTVWHALHDAGLDAYYEFARQEEAPPAQARVSGGQFDYLDSPDVLAAFSTPVGADSRRAALRVDGLRCGACVWLIESLPRVVPGLLCARVNLARSTVELNWDTTHTSLARIGRTLDRMGYQLSLPGTGEGAALAARRRATRDLGVAGALTMNAMGIAFALYGGILEGMPASIRITLQCWSVALALAAVAGPGRVFFRNAWVALRARVGHMDQPVSLGIGGAVVAGLVATATGHGAIYCEGATMLVFLLLVGRYLQQGQQERAIARVAALFEMLPSSVRRVEASGVREVRQEDLREGDLLEVPPHELVGADGTLESADCHFDLSAITGESRPVRVTRGAAVLGGSRALESLALIRVTHAGASSHAGRIAALMESAAASRAPICELADRIAGWFLLAVMAGAAVTLAWWWPRLGGEEAASRAIALLVVTCPCALGLATPLALMTGIGAAARDGVLVKSASVLQRLARPGTLVLDKTGTLTTGRPTITEVEGDANALAYGAAVERASLHPVGAAIVRTATPPLPEATDIREYPGEGVVGSVEGHEVAVGGARLLARLGVEWHESGPGADACASRVAIAIDGRVCAVVAIADQLRGDARATLAKLVALGWWPLIASGDDPQVAASIGAAAGLSVADVRGGMTPEEKLSLLRDGGLPRPIVMVGDGINDLAALAGADCGIAVRSATRGAMHASDACLSGDGLGGLVGLMARARKTMRTIHLNLAISLAYNAAGGAAAFLGLVNPIVAAVLMPVSGLTVLAISIHGGRRP